MRGFLVALQFLTILPLSVSFRENDFLRAVPCFPLVGYVLGLALAAAYMGVGPWVEPLTAAVLVVALEILLTGALHLDGLMDTADALAAGKNREETLAIFRDTHAGAKAVVAAVTLLLVKVALLAELEPPEAVGVIVAFPVLGRWVLALAVLCFPYAREQGLGTPLGAGRPSPGWAVGAALVPVLAAYLWLGWPLLAVLGVVSAGALGAGKYFTRRLGGLVGDLYGAFAEAGEVAGLALLMLLPALV